jgi:hypothetical protein
MKIRDGTTASRWQDPSKYAASWQWQTSLTFHDPNPPITLETIQLVIQDASHTVASDNVVLTQHQVLAVQDSTHVVASDNVSLTQHQILNIQNADNVVTSDNVSLTQHQVLDIQSSAHQVTSENISLTQHQILAIQNATHVVFSDNVVLGIIVPVPPVTPVQPQTPKGVLHINMPTEWGDPYKVRHIKEEELVLV